jgi:hypothetical protein
MYMAGEGQSAAGREKPMIRYRETLAPAIRQRSTRQLVALCVLVLSVVWNGGATASDVRLLMLDQDGCAWCARWDREIGTAYPLTTEGARAPLMRAHIGRVPEGVTLARPARLTPTFVLLADGREVGRIEGHPGEEFFYGMLDQLLDRLPPETTDPPSSN